MTSALQILYPDVEELQVNGLAPWMTIWSMPGKESNHVPIQKLSSVPGVIKNWVLDRHIYFGPGLRTENLGRWKAGSNHHVVAIPGVWSDIDILGPGHKETNLPTTLDDAIELAYSIPEIPPSMIIFSGGGIYPFWLFKEVWTLETEDEQNEAQGLLRRFERTILNQGKARGWNIDSVADLRHVIRLPGSLNIKDPINPKRVVIYEHHPDRRYNPDDFKPYLADIQTTTVHSALPADDDNFQPADLEKILQKCGWMKHCQDDADNLPEPEWYAMLSVVARCADAEQWAHDLSRPYEEYNEAETSMKLVQAQERTGPVTCERVFKELNGQYCIGCTHKKKSPISLGRTHNEEGNAMSKDGTLTVLKGGQPDKPMIQLLDGQLPQIVDQAEQVLINAGEQIYQREQLLVRPAFLGVGEQGDITRHEGTPVLLLLDKIFLTDRLGRVARWQRFDAKMQDFKEIDAPQKVAQTLLSRTGHWNLPFLRAIVECPTLRADGSILQIPGYDSTSGLLFKPGISFDPIPEVPSADDMIKAIEDLEDLVSTFPFEAPEDKSVALSAILTGLVRPSLSGAPLIGFSAPMAGTGKSLLADIVALLVTGRRVSAFSQGVKDEEFSKRIDTALLQGDSLVNIDNVSRPLMGDDLCQALTQNSKRVRILGRSEMPECSCSTFFMATGNHLVLRGDMNRRGLICRLDAGVERPEERRFERNIYKFVPKHRSSLVRAGLVLLREYLAQGCPDLGLKPMGSFDTWSTWIRGALVWAGYVDPYKTRERILVEDPALEEGRNLYHAWDATFGSMPTTVKYAISEAYRDPDTELKDALEAIAATKNGINSRRLGKWLAKHKNVIIEGLRLVNAGEYQKTVQWKIVRV